MYIDIDRYIDRYVLPLCKPSKCTQRNRFRRFDSRNLQPVFFTGTVLARRTRERRREMACWVAAMVGLGRGSPAGHFPPVVGALLRRQSSDGLPFLFPATLLHVALRCGGALAHTQDDQEAWGLGGGDGGVRPQFPCWALSAGGQRLVAPTVFRRPFRRIYRRGFRDLEFCVISAVGYAHIWGKSYVYLGLRVLPEVNPKSPFGLIPDSTGSCSLRHYCMSFTAAAVLLPIRKTTKRHGVWVGERCSAATD